MPDTTLENWVQVARGYAQKRLAGESVDPADFAEMLHHVGNLWAPIVESEKLHTELDYRQAEVEAAKPAAEKAKAKRDEAVKSANAEVDRCKQALAVAQQAASSAAKQDEDVIRLPERLQRQAEKVASALTGMFGLDDQIRHVVETRP